jgi:hypothetical protein
VRTGSARTPTDRQVCDRRLRIASCFHELSFTETLVFGQCNLGFPHPFGCTRMATRTVFLLITGRNDSYYMRVIAQGRHRDHKTLKFLLSALLEQGLLEQIGLSDL